LRPVVTHSVKARACFQPLEPIKFKPPVSQAFAFTNATCAAYTEASFIVVMQQKAKAAPKAPATAPAAPAAAAAIAAVQPAGTPVTPAMPPAGTPVAPAAPAPAAGAPAAAASPTPEVGLYKLSTR
jgi:hypothetical protein